MDFDAWRRRPDRTSLSHLLESVEPRVYRICLRILKDPHDAEEAKQEVLLEIASGLAAVVDAEHFDRWVGKVAFRTALDRRRGHLRRQARERDAAGRAPNGSSRDDALHLAMAELDDDDRAILIERHFDQRTFRDIGRRHDISAVAARKRVSKAQSRLKKLLGGVLLLGAGAMKAKAAVAALVLVSVLVGGAWLASSRNDRREGIRPQSSLEYRSSSWASLDPGPVPATSNPAIESEAMKAPESHDDGAREAFLQKLQRYWTMGKRRDEFLLVRDELMTKEVLMQIQGLEKDMSALERELSMEVSRFPKECLAFFQSLEWSPTRNVIGRLLIPTVQAEVTDDPSKPGPILKALLPMRYGGDRDRDFLFRLISDLDSGNRIVTEVCLTALDDKYGEVRRSSLHAISKFAEAGNLRETLTGHQARLEAIAKEDAKDLPPVFAYIALAGIGSESADQFILQSWLQAATERAQRQCLHAMNLIAPRVMVAHEQPIATLVMQCLDKDGGTQNLNLILLSLRLSEANRLDALRLAALRAPSREVGLGDGFRSIMQRVEAGESESVIKVLEQLRSKGWDATSAVRTAGGIGPVKPN